MDTAHTIHRRCWEGPGSPHKQYSPATVVQLTAAESIAGIDI